MDETKKRIEFKCIYLFAYLITETISKRLHNFLKFYRIKAYHIFVLGTIDVRNKTVVPEASPYEV